MTLSANQQGDYAFLLPISAMVWRKIAKYEPICLLTEGREDWDTPTGRVVVDMIGRLELRKHYIGRIKPPYRTSVQAQCSRQHIALHKQYDAEEDYILTADVDMWPLAEWWFNKQDWSKDVHVWYANAWGYRWYTTGYIGMKVKTWREVMKYIASGDLAPVMEAALEKHLTPERDTWQEWWFDEHYFTSRLKAWSGHPDRIQFMERSGGPPLDRVDRSNWTMSTDGKVDAHVLRPATSQENLPRVMELAAKLLSPNEMEMVNGFVKRYMEAKA